MFPLEGLRFSNRKGTAHSDYFARAVDAFENPPKGTLEMDGIILGRLALSRFRYPRLLYLRLDKHPISVARVASDKQTGHVW